MLPEVSIASTTFAGRFLLSPYIKDCSRDTKTGHLQEFLGLVWVNTFARRKIAGQRDGLVTWSESKRHGLFLLWPIQKEFDVDFTRLPSI